MWAVCVIFYQFIWVQSESVLPVTQSQKLISNDTQMLLEHSPGVQEDFLSACESNIIY